MAGIVDVLRAAQGGQAIGNLGKQFGLTAEQAERAVAVLAPELAKGFERNLLDRKGLADLMQALATGDHARYADDANVHASDAANSDGEEILGHLLGSKTGSRQLAAYGQQETGIPADVLKQMLPALATLFMGAVSKTGAQALNAIPGGIGGLEDILRRLPQGSGGDIGDILRRLPQGGGGAGGGLGDILGEVFKRLPQGGGMGGGGQQGSPSGNSGGGYGIPPLPGGSGGSGRWGGSTTGSDKGGGGFQIPGFPEVRGDAPGAGRDAGRDDGGSGRWGGGSGQTTGGGSPLPLPGGSAPQSGGNNPYGDAGDIIRGGGVTGGLLATILRSLFGSILGRSAAPAGRGGGGMLSWLIRLVVMRYGWRIVTGIFRGMLRR